MAPRRNSHRGKMSASEAGRKGGRAPHAKRGQRGSDQNISDEQL